MQLVEYLIFVIPSALCLISMGVFFYIQKRNTKKIQVYILRKVNDTYQIVKKIKIDKSDKEIKYNGKTFVVNLEICIFDTNNKPILHYDYDSCEPINPFITTSKKNPNTLQSYMESKIYPKIFGSDGSNFLMVLLIVVCVTSIVISVYSVFMLLDMQNVLKTILNSMKSSVVIK